MSTELVSYENQKPTFGWVRDGIQGNYQVVWKMIDIVRDSVVKDKGVENTIKQELALRSLNSYSNTRDILEVVYNFVKDHVDYLQDIAGKTESIKDARTTLEDGYGDCDDEAILNATLLADLGYEPKLVIGKYPETKSYQHVYCVVYVDGQRYVFDQTLPDAEFNKEVQGMQIQEFGVFDERPETDGLEGLFRNFRSLVTETVKNAKQELPMLSNFAGLGLLGNHALKNVLGSVAADPQSLNKFGSDISGQITDIIIQLQNGIISQPQASAQARKVYSQLFSYPETGGETFIAIENRLKQKLDYIDSFNTLPNETSINTSLLTYVGYGVLILGVIYLIKKSSRN